MPQSGALIFVVALITLLGFGLGYRRATRFGRTAGRPRLSSSLPIHYASLIGLWCALPSLLLLLAWNVAEPMWLDQIIFKQLSTQHQQLSDGQKSLLLNPIKTALQSGDTASLTPQQKVLAKHWSDLDQRSQTLRTAMVLILSVTALAFGLNAAKPKLKARIKVEKTVRMMLIACSLIAILTTLGIVLSVTAESLRFFDKIPILDFMFGLHWSPQTAIRADQVGSSGSFGAVPLFVGTMLISTVALLIAVPIGLMAAIYLSEYASRPLRAFAKPALEILAGIPTVVYGFFAALTVAPALRGLGDGLGIEISSQSALAAGLVMGIMLIPFVSSLSDDVIRAVPRAMRDGSFGLGATHSETILRVIVPAALPGIVGGVLLAASRAIGETMIVVMAAGLAAKLTANPLESVTTVTVQIVTLLTGDQEFDSSKTLAAFALGLMLFFTTLALNVIALQVVRRYREQYE